MGREICVGYGVASHLVSPRAAGVASHRRGRWLRDNGVGARRIRLEGVGGNVLRQKVLKGGFAVVAAKIGDVFAPKR